MCLNGFFASLSVVPGAGCGTVTPLVKVNADDLPAELTSVEDIECGVVNERKRFAEVMKKVGFAKCKHQDLEHCRHVRGKSTVNLL